MTVHFEDIVGDIVQLYPDTKFCVCISNGVAMSVQTDRRTDRTDCLIRDSPRARRAFLGKEKMPFLSNF